MPRRRDTNWTTTGLTVAACELNPPASETDTQGRVDGGEEEAATTGATTGVEAEAGVATGADLEVGEATIGHAEEVPLGETTNASTAEKMATGLETAPTETGPTGATDVAVVDT